MAAQKGDPEAINDLLLHCQPDLQRFARKVCATPEDVEDAVQETLWVVARKIDTLRAASAFTSWLFRVVKHHCFRLLREEQWQLVVTVPDDWCDQTARVESESVSMHEVATAIANLPALYREVLILRDVENLTAPEVAARLDITVDAVKSRLHRARMSVRAALDG